MEHKPSIWKRKYLKVFSLFSIIGLIVGAISGYLYYNQIGCADGSCAMKSNPYLMTSWGAVMGYLLGDMMYFKPKKKIDKEIE